MPMIKGNLPSSALHACNMTCYILLNSDYRIVEVTSFTIFDAEGEGVQSKANQ